MIRSWALENSWKGDEYQLRMRLQVCKARLLIGSFKWLLKFSTITLEIEVVKKMGIQVLESSRNCVGWWQGSKHVEHGIMEKHKLDMSWKLFHVKILLRVISPK